MAAPAAGSRDYPSTLGEFFEWFQTDADCLRYIEGLRWPNGFTCPRCGVVGSAWLTARREFVCSSCRKQTALLAGTIFEGGRVPLTLWFRAAWLATSSKAGVSAKELQRELGVTYKTAWLIQHKLRLAMKRPGRDNDKLTGEVEVDESYLGGPTPGGKRGRGAEGKLIVAIAVERRGLGVKSQRWKLGRTRIHIVPDCTAKTLLDFVSDTCEDGATIYTDGLAAYKGLKNRGYDHRPIAVSQGNDPAHVALPCVHRVASLLKRWLMGTHHGGIGAQHAEAYLDEFVFRFNRRSFDRGWLFHRLMQNAVVIRKLTYDTLVLSRRGQAGKQRGPAKSKKRAPRGRAAMAARAAAANPQPPSS